MSQFIQPQFNVSELQQQLQKISQGIANQKEIKVSQGSNKLALGLSILVGLGLLAFVILNYVGLGYITAVVFDKKEWKDLSTTEKNLCRMFAVISWIALALGIFSALNKK
jgi:hypothetical protein